MLRSAGSVFRSAVLSRVQLPVAQQGLPALTWGTFRGFGAGTFLDKSEVTDRVVKVVKDFSKVDPAKVTPKSTFQGDLGLDSLDTVEIVMAFEEEFSVEIPDSEADKILSVADAIEYLAGHPQAK